MLSIYIIIFIKCSCIGITNIVTKCANCQLYKNVNKPIIAPQVNNLNK